MRHMEEHLQYTFEKTYKYYNDISSEKLYQGSYM